MLFEKWRARRMLQYRTDPVPVTDVADPVLFEVVESLRAAVGADCSLGDPHWHYRWEGEVQLVGLDATTRSVTDVRQRLTRLVHEIVLRHLPARAKRVLAVALVDDERGADLRGWLARLDDDRGEIGVLTWRSARRRIAVLVIDRSGRHRLSGADRDVEAAYRLWVAGWEHANPAL
jgi:hypothetical protein